MSEEVNNETFERVWKIVSEIFVEERHFNDLQSRYRTMASTWLLASFSAIGFVISKVIHIGIPRELLTSGIAVAGLIGIMLLWILDLLVYHRLLDSCFIEGLILEEKYSWLPPFRHNMMATMKGEGVLFRVVGFYIGMVTILVLVAGGSLSLWFTQYNIYIGFLTSLITLIIAFFVGNLMRNKTENTAAIEKRLVESRKENK